MAKNEIINRNRVKNISSTVIGVLTKTTYTISNAIKNVSQGYHNFGFLLENMSTNYYVDKVILNINYKDNGTSTITPVIRLYGSSVYDPLDLVEIISSITGEPFNGTNIVHMDDSGHAVAKDVQQPQVFGKGILSLNFEVDWDTPSTITLNAKVIIFWCPIN